MFQYHPHPRRLLAEWVTELYIIFYISFDIIFAAIGAVPATRTTATAANMISKKIAQTIFFLPRKKKKMFATTQKSRFHFPYICVFYNTTMRTAPKNVSSSGLAANNAISREKDQGDVGGQNVPSSTEDGHSVGLAAHNWVAPLVHRDDMHLNIYMIQRLYCFSIRSLVATTTTTGKQYLLFPYTRVYVITTVPPPHCCRLAES